MKTREEKQNIVGFGLRAGVAAVCDRRGIVPQLARLLDSADARVQPTLRTPWLVGLVHGEENKTIEVTPEGSPTDAGYNMVGVFVTADGQIERVERQIGTR